MLPLPSQLRRNAEPRSGPSHPEISMKFLRYLDPEGNVQYGSEEPDGSVLRLQGDPFGGFSASGERARIHKLLAPIAPAQIFCIGLNYRKHAEETGALLPEHPILFMKGVNAAQNPGDPIWLPRALPSHEVDYEGELAVVIGKSARNVRRERALDYVLGYTCGNDVSARDWQKRFGDGQWCRGKTFDTFAPLGPRLVTPEDIPNPNALGITTFLNGERVQESNTEDMIFDVRRLIEFLSGSTTLAPGTVIFTGTPSGVGMARKPPRWLAPGDEITVEIERIGRLTSPVVLEPEERAP
jgi:2-keto-4-pentenoate hydratase/2-oxohepta-3-ene-1,7-dioic acid hydratase in catechol pathway